MAPGPIPLRALIDAVVRAEVAAFDARAERRRFLRVLTEEALAHGVESGAARMGDVEADTRVDPDEAVATALLAHEDGLFRALVDDKPVDDLDELVDLGPGTRLLFLRLVALSGGC